MARTKIDGGSFSFITLTEEQPGPVAGKLAWVKVKDQEGELQTRAAFTHGDRLHVLPGHTVLLGLLEKIAPPVEGPTECVVEVTLAGTRKGKPQGKKKPFTYFVYDVVALTDADAEEALQDEARSSENFLGGA